MTESARLARNASRLSECHPVFADRVSRIIAQLEADGYRPRIQEAWRSEADQRDKAKRKVSKVLWGFHNATSADGRPEALAVDLLDDDHPVVPSMKYLLKLAAHAKRAQCQTGIAWGLVPSVRARLESAILNGEWSYRGAVGWDACHLECADVTISEARHGVRPT